FSRPLHGCGAWPRFPSRCCSSAMRCCWRRAGTATPPTLTCSKTWTRRSSRPRKRPHPCHIRCRTISDREGHTPANGVTVYYPFALVDLLSYREVDDDKDGRVLLSFVDEDGCEVTIRLHRELVEALKARLASPPDTSQPSTT